MTCDEAYVTVQQIADICYWMAAFNMLFAIILTWLALERFADRRAMVNALAPMPKQKE